MLGIDSCTFHFGHIRRSRNDGGERISTHKAVDSGVPVVMFDSDAPKSKSLAALVAASWRAS